MSAKMTPEERRARIREIEHRNHALGRHWVRVETCEDCGAALAAPSTPEPSGLDVETMRDILGRMHVGGRHPADLSWLAANGVHILDALRAAPSTEPALDVERQFAAVDKSLLATFQWSDKDYKRFGLAASALLKNLHDIGWDVTVSDPEKAAKYARLAESKP